MAGIKPKDFSIAGAGQIFDDTMFHVQEIGGGNADDDVKFPATWIRDYVLASLGLRIAEITVPGLSSVTHAMLEGETTVIFRFLTPSNATVRVGTSVNGTEVLEDEDCLANTYISIARNFVAVADLTLHFTGFPAGSTIKILIIT